MFLLGTLKAAAMSLLTFVNGTLLPAAGTELLHCALKAITQPIVQIAQASGWLDADTWSVMDQYCENLTEKAKMGKIHDAIGRDKEIYSMIDILTRNGKGNPCAVGEAGVGKTALVEGLAYRIANGKVPEDFKNKKIIKVNMVNLIAGKAYNMGNGEVGRMRALFDAAAKDKDIILFIDEFHQIVQCNAAELFKTYLDRGDIRVIAATTTSEYSYISKDPALERRFTRVFLEEPTQSETLQILKGIKNDFEDGGKVHITDEALAAAVNLTGKYMKNRSYPDKAIDVVSSASKLVQRRNKSLSKSLDVPNITEEDIQSVISSETNIPVGKISESESQLLNSLEERIEDCVKGQSEAVKVVSDAIRCGRAGMSSNNKPRASFLFTGTSGVGKTLLAQEIGREVGSSICIDLGQNYSKSAFLEKVWKKPYSVILFDKLEEADSSTIRMISGILENGYTINGSGNKVDFTNTIIIMTSKVGEKIILNCSDSDEDTLKDKVYEETEKVFGESFISNISEVLVFNKLNLKSFEQVSDILFDSFEKIMKSQKINLKIDESVKKYISLNGINHKLGARQIERIICEEIGKPVANMMIKGKIRPQDIVVCSFSDGKIKFEIQQ